MLRREAQATADRTKAVLPDPDAADVEQKVEKLVEQSKALRKELNAIMKGERPPFAMLEAHSATPALPRSIASFQHVYSMPRPMLARFAAKANPRLRLLPPYREHVSHSFGRYFSRIGLLQDIPRYPV
ncbi:MAG: hypothetical protein FWD73_17650 [Polyangiaceae bacterium]|nr:hypothetical protein [Polyangiaceae bacterium]